MARIHPSPLTQAGVSSAIAGDIAATGHHPPREHLHGRSKAASGTAFLPTDAVVVDLDGSGRGSSRAGSASSLRSHASRASGRPSAVFAARPDFPKLDRPPLNPFLSATPHISGREWVQIIVSALLLIPLIKAVLIILIVGVAWLYAKIVLLFYPKKDAAGRSIPLPATSRWMTTPIFICVRAVLFAFGVTWITVKGRPKGPIAAPIVVANHSSLLDGPLMLLLSHGSPVGKIELSKVPVLSPLLDAARVVFVDRLNTNSRKQVLDEIAHRASDGRFPPVLLFPQGTVCNNRCVTMFHLGAFAPGLPVQPVVLRYPFANLDISWGPLVPTARLALRMLCQLTLPVEAEFLPTYYPSDAEKADPIMFGNNVRAAMVAHGGLTATEHCYDDVRLLRNKRLRDFALAHVVPQAMCKDLAALLALPADQVFLLISRFSSYCLGGEGSLSRERFKAALRLGSEAYASSLFAMCDVDRDGAISFVDAVMSLAWVNPDASIEYRAGPAFVVMDTDSDGIVRARDVARAMEKAHEILLCNLSANQTRQTPTAAPPIGTRKLFRKRSSAINFTIGVTFTPAGLTAMSAGAFAHIMATSDHAPPDALSTPAIDESVESPLSDGMNMVGGTGTTTPSKAQCEQPGVEGDRSVIADASSSSRPSSGAGNRLRRTRQQFATELTRVLGRLGVAVEKDDAALDKATFRRLCVAHPAVIEAVCALALHRVGILLTTDQQQRKARHRSRMSLASAGRA